MSTAAAPIRFRCFRCQKLLGVSKSKIGAVVACPQCSAELIVPEPDESPELSAPSPSKSSSSSRIEPVVVPWDAPPEPEGHVSTSDAAFPTIHIEPVKLRATAPTPRPQKSANTREGPAPDLSAIGATSPGVAPPEPVAVPLSVEAPSLRESGPMRAVSPSGVRGVRRDDVVLPRAVLTLWTFLVLLGLVFAFTSGLLIGRFLWARGIPANVPAARSISRGFDRNSGGSARQPDCILSAREV